jgi:hypothetical protein
VLICIHNLYVYTAPPITMSGKLYHRVKKGDGKWTWVACQRDYFKSEHNLCPVCATMEIETDGEI